MKIRTYSELDRADASDLMGQVRAQLERVEDGLAGVRNLVPVMSGKGGVGKSLIAAAIAMALADKGLRIGLLDADLNGPTASRFLLPDEGTLQLRGDRVGPATADGIVLMSMALLLEPEAPLEWKEPGSESFVWRGAQERGALREFLADVEWGVLDLLLVDLPPGTQRLIELAELVPRLTGAVTVTLPSLASETSVTRSLELARSRGVRLLGVVENMSEYHCPACATSDRLFSGDAGRRLADRFDTELLGRVPFDPVAGRIAEEGRLREAMDTAAGRRWRSVAERVADRLMEPDDAGSPSPAIAPEADT